MRNMAPAAHLRDPEVQLHRRRAAGWLCNREGGGIRYGRIFKPAADLHGYSVDVVDMKDIAGPHHVHPNGEIDLVMPLEGDARFDGRPAGWLVCPPGSAHRPTVSQGRALRALPAARRPDRIHLSTAAQVTPPAPTGPTGDPA